MRARLTLPSAPVRPWGGARCGGGGLGAVQEVESALLAVLLDLEHHPAQPVRDAAALLLAELPGDEGLFLVELREHPPHQLLTFVREAEQHEPAVARVPGTPHQVPCLQRAGDPGERALGDAGLLGHVTSLGLTPDPDHPEHDERGPGEVGLAQDRVLQVLTDGRGGPVDVGHHRHLFMADRHSTELRLRQLLGFGDGSLAWHEHTPSAPPRRVPGRVSFGAKLYEVPRFPSRGEVLSVRS